jgi:hypothetical protein
MARRLFTEACVRGLPRGSELVLGAEAVATPSALDLAFQRGVRVVYSDGPGGPGRAPRAPGDAELWSRIVAQDGTYVVDVRAGRATVHRVTPEGPALVGTGGTS